MVGTAKAYLTWHPKAPGTTGGPPFATHGNVAPSAACTAQRAHVGLLHHHSAPLRSEAGWVVHCTSPGKAGSAASVGTLWSTAAADPRQQRTLSRLPSAARTRAACSTTTQHTLPEILDG